MNRADEYKSKGFIEQKQKGYYVTRIRAKAGNMTSAQLQKVAQLADKYGEGYVHFTTRQAVEIPGVLEENYTAIMEEIRGFGMLNAVCGPRIRTLVACPGAAYCKFGIVDTVSLAGKLDELYVGKELPAKTKIGISGCPNSCAKPQENDIGLQGALVFSVADGCIGCNACVKTCKVKAITVQDKQPRIDQDLCVGCGRCSGICRAKALVVEQKGYNIYVGGKIGRQPILGTKIFQVVAEDEVILHLEAILNTYKRLANKGERVADMLRRIGVDFFRSETEREIDSLRKGQI